MLKLSFQDLCAWKRIESANWGGEGRKEVHRGSTADIGPAEPYLVPAQGPDQPSLVPTQGPEGHKGQALPSSCQRGHPLQNSFLQKTVKYSFLLFNNYYSFQVNSLGHFVYTMNENNKLYIKRKNFTSSNCNVLSKRRSLQFSNNGLRFENITD